MVDEIINASPSKFRFPEAGLRIMVTSHFGPKTRLRMASRLIITEVRLLLSLSLTSAPPVCASGSPPGVVLAGLAAGCSSAL